MITDMISKHDMYLYKSIDLPCLAKSIFSITVYKLVKKKKKKEKRRKKEKVVECIIRQASKTRLFQHYLFRNISYLCRNVLISKNVTCIGYMHVSLW